MPSEQVDLATPGTPAGAPPTPEELRLRNETGGVVPPTRRTAVALLLLGGLTLAALAVALFLVLSARGSVGAWRRSDLKPVTQPAPLGGRFLLYAASEGGLRILALDARSGSTVWSAVASPSGIAPGQPPELALVDGYVIYLREVSGRRLAQLVASDPSTGREVWQSRAGHFRPGRVSAPANRRLSARPGTYPKNRSRPPC